MSKLARKNLLLADIETTYDSDESPTAGANAILTRGLSIVPYGGPKVQRGLDRPTLGNNRSINTGPEVQVTFEVEAAGSGTAATPAAYGILLRACAHAETIASDVQYDPISGSFESVSMHFFRDRTQHIITGARGTVKLMYNGKQLPFFQFRFIGHYTRPTAVSNPTPDFSAFNVPEPVNNANTGTVSVQGFSALVLESLEFDQAGDLKNRDLPGSKVVQFVDRAPRLSITIEEPLTGTKNFYEAAESHAGTDTVGAVQIIHGSAAGKIVQFDSALFQIDDITQGESDGIATLKLDGACLPTGSGDDDYKITTK